MIPLALERPGAVRFEALPPLALYVHIPWCVRKCPYCDFNSHERAGSLPESEYLNALFRDLEASLPQIWGRRVFSIFVGGGTPSLFSPQSIDALLSGVRARLALDPQAEITLEANPGTVEAARFRGFRGAGVNRISIGVQSFDDRMLAALGRIHSADEARRAIDAALASFDNVNIDLMYALPGQTPAMARADLDEALRFGPPHVSAYQLTLEPNTVFWSKPPALPEHDVAADMQLVVEDQLGAAGYEHYETSAFARPGRRCRHNLNYWQFGDYLGIGAGAHGKLSFPDRVTRHARAKQPNEYMKPDARVEEGVVSAAELPFEFMLNALRLVDGFDVALFSERTGLPFQIIQSSFEDVEKRGLVARDWKHIRPTERGRRFLNDLLEAFLPAASSTGRG
ncbi:MAG TPA: radical SAM family heme chaperone HemW [Burkholderiales bacterium]|nr:radical SAM family heme chaperone HemW [Burkholderiales bacterium]